MNAAFLLPNYTDSSLESIKLLGLIDTLFFQIQKL